jgi:hypothetical protein
MRKAMRVRHVRSAKKVQSGLVALNLAGGYTKR